MTKLTTSVDDQRELTEGQKEVVFQFMVECPELRDDQVRAWSAKHPNLAEAFETYAEIHHQEREDLELEDGDMDAMEADREPRPRSDRSFSA